jgi:hypothetical protein
MINTTTLNKLITNDYINVLIEKFNLEKYKYIDNVIDFSLLTLRGSLKYINKYTQELKNGGLLVKIYKKDNLKWHGIIKKPNNKTYHISFDSNYIFYISHKSRSEKLRNTLEVFMKDIDAGKYLIN